MRHTFEVAGMCASMILTCAFFAPYAYAQEPRDVRPSWAREEQVDVRVFQHVLEVAPEGIMVPTLIVVPVRDISLVGSGAVARNEMGKFTPAVVESYRSSFETPVDVFLYGGPSVPIPVLELADLRPETAIDLPFVEGVSNHVQFRFIFQEPITTSEFRLMLAPYSSLPTHVRIQRSGDTPTTLVARKDLTGTSVTFPEVTGGDFLVDLEYVQPVRLAGARFVPRTTQVVREDLLYLIAQPGDRYTVYFDPDRSYGYLAGDFSIDPDRALTVEAAVPPRMNPSYVPADSDSDGVPDERDNCVRIENKDQRDVDGNRVGDACDDFDRDGVMNVSDNCPDAPNRYQEDTDHDGVGDLCDERENRFTERYPFVPWVGMGIAALTLIGLLVLTIHGKGGSARREEDAAA